MPKGEARHRSWPEVLLTEAARSGRSPATCAPGLEAATQRARRIPGGREATTFAPVGPTRWAFLESAAGAYRRS
jgi:hypothetical protein